MDASQFVRVRCPLCDGVETRLERTIDGFAVERCATCRLVFMNPQPPPDNLAEHYRVRNTQHLIDLYARIAATPSVQRQCRARLDWLETLRPQKGRLLDFACANGFFFEEAQKRGWDAHGVDFGQWAGAAAEARGLKNLHVGDLKALAFPDRWFDVIYAAQVFEHLPRPKSDLAEFRRILKPGGLLYIDVPNYRTLSIVFDRDDFSLNAPPQHVNYFTPETLTTLLEREGFGGVRITTEGGLKWENLLGRRIRSEIQDVYASGATSAPARTPPAAARLSGRLADAVRAFVVRPLLYKRCKVGMTLAAVAYRG